MAVALTAISTRKSHSGKKTLDEYKNHVKLVIDDISDYDFSDFNRIFIGSGNALGVETKKLCEAISYTAKEFTVKRGRTPKRIATYGRTKDITGKGARVLQDLKDVAFEPFENYGVIYNSSGLKMIYWGVESGSSDVLRYVNKGCTQEDILEAADAVNRSGIETSVMIMPGLGGMKHYDSHIEGTAKVLGAINPKFLTFMGINPSRESRYYRNMMKEMDTKGNRPLTAKELATQMKEIIANMPAIETSVGCFDNDVDKVGNNPITFKRKIYDWEDKRDLVNSIGSTIRVFL